MSIEVSGFKECEGDMDGRRIRRSCAEDSGANPVGEYIADARGAAAGVELLDVAPPGRATCRSRPRGRRQGNGAGYDAEAVEGAARACRGRGLEMRVIEGDAEEMQFADGSFDRVT